MSWRIACDGACIGNPGPGGWAAVIRGGPDGAAERVLVGGEPDTTNNRMELMAAIAGLDALDPGGDVTIESDSEYVVLGIEKWLPGWVRKGWVTRNRQPVRNRDLWMRLDAARKRHRVVRFQWVRGHAGHPGNERADALANAEARRIQQRES